MSWLKRHQITITTNTVIEQCYHQMFTVTHCASTNHGKLISALDNLQKDYGLYVQALTRNQLGPHVHLSAEGTSPSGHSDQKHLDTLRTYTHTIKRIYSYPNYSVADSSHPRTWKQDIHPKAWIMVMYCRAGHDEILNQMSSSSNRKSQNKKWGFRVARNSDDQQGPTGFRPCCIGQQICTGQIGCDTKTDLYTNKPATQQHVHKNPTRRYHNSLVWPADG
jgi:hypothetical protein